MSVRHRIAAGACAAPPDLAVSPREVIFTDAYDGRQLLVSEGEHDVTRAARYSISDAVVVRIDDRGYLRPAGDGAAPLLPESSLDPTCEPFLWPCAWILSGGSADETEVKFGIDDI